MIFGSHAHALMSLAYIMQVLILPYGEEMLLIMNIYKLVKGGMLGSTKFPYLRQKSHMEMGSRQ